MPMQSRDERLKVAVNLIKETTNTSLPGRARRCPGRKSYAYTKASGSPTQETLIAGYYHNYLDTALLALHELSHHLHNDTRGSKASRSERRARNDAMMFCKQLFKAIQNEQVQLCRPPAMRGKPNSRKARKAAAATGAYLAQMRANPRALDRPSTEEVILAGLERMGASKKTARKSAQYLAQELSEQGYFWVRRQ